MSSASSIQTLYQMPDLRRHGKRNASIPAAQTCPSSRSQSSGASAIGSQPSRVVVLHMAIILSPKAMGTLIWRKTGYRGAFSSAEQQEQQPALLSVKTG